MKRIGVSILLAVTLVVYALPNANAVVTPGSKCSKAGAQQTYKGKVYTCVKSGKKLVWDRGVSVPKAESTATPSPIVTPTSTPSATPSATPTSRRVPETFGRAPYFYFATNGRQVILTIPQGEFDIFKLNGFAAKGFISRAIDSSGKVFLGKVGVFPISGDLRLTWDVTYGDIWNFSIAPVDDQGQGLWSQPRTFSVQKRQEIISGNSNPIGGKYLLGDIGPAGGRIFLTPDSAVTHLKGYSVVGPKTPQGYFYEIATVESFFGFGTPCWPGMNGRLEPISNKFSDSDGKLNTQLIIDSGLCSRSSMAYEVRALNVLGFQDWFIPSENEIAPLYTISTPWSLWSSLSRTPEECILSSLSPFGAFYKVNERGYKTFQGGNVTEVSGLMCAVRKFKS